MVEANVFDYLATSTNQTKSVRLASDYRAVYDWCGKENETITDEARKYRPTLFVNKGKREVIELPPLGKFGFEKLEPSQPYDFEEFNAYEYAGARSLDQADDGLQRASGAYQPAANEIAKHRPNCRQQWLG
ncbi:MAG: hypothetical protein AAGF98_02190 [Cyanobacteria bacterium P01_H01_bin.153]